ncbi:MAG: hypothetical protein AAFR77_04800 [Cyanobacteria bacterium J06631_2]
MTKTKNENPNVLDLENTEEFQFSNSDQPVSILGNNCKEKKEEVENGYDVARFGSCSHPTAADANAYAIAVLLPQVIAAGGVFNTSAGHKTVSNKVGSIPAPNTYLSYARGNRS